MRKFRCLIIGLIFLPSFVAAYVASSDNFRLQFDSINFGGGLSSSGNYTQESTFGEVSTGRGVTEEGSVLNAGYQQADPVILTCVDPKANNFGGPLPCTYDDDGGGTDIIKGCTDPAAENYNSLATRDNGSCVYSVPNVLNFEATPDSDLKLIQLDWQKPPNSPHFTFSRVIILRRTNTFPTNPNDGDLVYQGTLQTTNDSAVVFDVNYYYTIFVQGADGRFSSGVVDVAKMITKTPSEEEVPPDEGEDEIDDGEGPGSGRDTGPFDDLPVVSEDEVSQEIKGVQFLIRQFQEIDKPFDRGSRVVVNPDKDITFLIKGDRAPAVLKIIGATIFYPGDQSKIFSFILRANDQKTVYEATIGKLLPGRYHTSLYLINYENKTLTRVDGIIIVPGSLETVVTSSIQPFVSAAGAAAGILLTTTVWSLSDLVLILVRAFNTLLGFLTGRRRRASWGTVYDSVTKQPIDPAVVRVFRDGREMSMAITDIDGRYGFLLPNGQYRLVVGKTHYRFPSARLVGQSADELYDNLYFGETIQADKEHPVIRNIPLDPIGFDWNEFIKDRANYFRLYSKRERIRRQILNGVFWGGFIFSVMLSLYLPSTINFAVSGIYLLIFLWHRFLAWRRPIVTVRRKATGETIPFALVRFFLADLGYEAKSVVTDELGRFYALLRPGKYYYTVEEKTPDGSYLRVYQSPPEYLKRGLKEGNIDV